MKVEIIKVDDNASRIKCEKFNDMFIMHSPFGNCQTYSMSYALRFAKLTKDEVKDVLEAIFERTQKRQMLIDLNEIYSKQVLELLKPWYNDVISMPYTSTNGSKMILHLIQWDAETCDI